MLLLSVAQLEVLFPICEKTLRFSRVFPPDPAEQA